MIGVFFNAKNFMFYNHHDEKLYYSLDETKFFGKGRWEIYDAKKDEHLFELKDKSKITTHPRGEFIYQGGTFEIIKKPRLRRGWDITQQAISKDKRCAILAPEICVDSCGMKSLDETTQCDSTSRLISAHGKRSIFPGRFFAQKKFGFPVG